MKKYRGNKLIEVYLSIMVVVSVILGLLALWALIRQYNVVNSIVQAGGNLSLVKGSSLVYFGKISILSFSLIIFSLILILVLSSYFSTRDIKREMDLAGLKNDFVSTISHELKTPLTSIRLLAERLLRLNPDETAKQREYYQVILSQSYQLSRLIGNILDFSRLGEGMSKSNFKETNIEKIVRDSAASYPVDLIKPGCKVDVEVRDSLPLLFVDKEYLERAFINLLDNAVKFSLPDGNISVRLGRLGSKKVFIEVEDHGVGVDVEDKEKVFERFYHRGQGTGLGLAFVKDVVLLHKGAVEVDEGAKGGSIFRMILPAVI